MDTKAQSFEDVDWIILARDKGRWQNVTDIPGELPYLQEQKVSQATNKEEANSATSTLKMDAVCERLPDYMILV
jgi:hypothetical protein